MTCSSERASLGPANKSRSERSHFTSPKDGTRMKSSKSSAEKNTFECLPGYRL